MRTTRLLYRSKEYRDFRLRIVLRIGFPPGSKASYSRNYQDFVISKTLCFD